ncbi:MAG: HAMP domain-containing histidine kinase [Lachnospiraceae bacterium]|nr:HAMP domain-containing histidine kinase [Lachnospiraceae bacterium]
MKLRTRLIISFCIIIFVPVMLTGITFWGFGQIQMKGIRQLYDGNTNPYELLLNSIRVLSHFTKADVEKLQKVAGEEPQKLEDLEYLAGINEELNEKYSFLVIRKGEEILYAGDQVTPESLPDFQEEEEGGSIGSYVDEDGKLLLKQIDFLYTDNTKGSMFIVTVTEKLLPEIKGMVTDMLLSIILILVFTAGMLVVWIYKGIFNPIRKLQIAAENIKDGNLDFTIEPENDDEIGALCQSFEEMRKRLKDSTEEKISNEKENKVLISNISHDLKTPITAIKGYVEGIIDGVADTQEKMDRYIRTIYNKANEMDTLINELTLYSQIDTNRIPYNFNRIHVSDYFEDCVEELTLDLETKGIGLAYFNYADENIRIIADPEQLKRVINNIVGNSVKYLDKQKGFINIRVRDVGDFIQVEIEDNGKGIAAKDLPYIFDRFYRTDTSRNSATGGSGIGLSIVKKIIEDHGGSIWATSKEHTGTIMYFVIRKYQEVWNE